MLISFHFLKWVCSYNSLFFFKTELHCKRCLMSSIYLQDVLFFKSSHVLVQLWTLNTVIFLYYRFGWGHFLLNVFYFVVAFKCIRMEFFCFVFKNANVQVFFSERKMFFLRLRIHCMIFVGEVLLLWLNSGIFLYSNK